MKASIAGILSLASAVSAQQTLYGQCGGIGWTGPTTCVSGACCKYQNDWYSQCLSGDCVASSTKATSTSTTRSTSTMTTSVRTSTTTSKVSSTSSSTKTSSTSGPVSTGFAKADGTLFNIDGVTKYYAGTNSYWIGFLTNDADVDLVMDQLAQSGLKILRVWGFNDVNSVPGSGTVYYQLLSASGSTINTGANGLQRMDKVVASAERAGIKLIINFVNNWDDYGGINAYVNAFGGNHTTWFTNAAAQAQYRAYIAAVVARYKGSSAVLAWELANEPRCQGCSTDVIYTWAASVSAYIKGLDANHMVTLGDEGFGMPGDGSYPYGYSEGVDWVKNLGISTLDFGTFHLYPSSWGTTNDWGNAWITNHAAECVKQNKPCLFEEYGVTSDHCTVESPWQDTALATPGIAGDLFWQLGTVLSSGQTSNDGNTIYYNTSEHTDKLNDWTCLVTNHVADINAKY